MIGSLLCFMSLVFLAVAAPAQKLVKDIRPGASGSRPISFASSVDFYGTLLFAATDGTNGLELWRSDGTASGTVMVKDIDPKGSGSPLELTVAGRQVFFVARDGVHGWEVFRTDGTAAGTRMVKDINPNQTSPLKPSHLTAVGSRVYFTVHDGVPGRHLWVSDGTAAGTHVVKRVSGSGSFPPAELTAFRGKLYLALYEAKSGRELWVSDGTANGTKLVKDIYPGGYYWGPFWYPYNGDPRYLTVVGDTLYFTVETGAHHAVWKTDGAPGGTVAVRSFVTGRSNIGMPHSYAAIGDTVLFNVGDSRGRELWKTDGTFAGTVLLKDIYPGSTASNPGYLSAHGDHVYFAATSPTSGRELWRSDGSPNGTVLVKDLHQGAGSSNPYHITPVGSRGVCFGAQDAVNGKELWVSDGSARNTFRISNINPTGDATPTDFVLTGGKVLFWANDGRTGIEPYRLDIGASAQSYGISCGVGNPGLRTTDPVLGQSMTFRGDRAPAGGYNGFLMLGAPVLPLSALGCDNIYYSVFTSAVELWAFQSVRSSWEFKLAVPNDSSLMGAVVTAQTHYLWVPNAFQNLRLTNAVRLTVGR